jgi:hypothetical protein
MCMACGGGGAATGERGPGRGGCGVRGHRACCAAGRAVQVAACTARAAPHMHACHTPPPAVNRGFQLPGGATAVHCALAGTLGGKTAALNPSRACLAGHRGLWRCKLLQTGTDGLPCCCCCCRPKTVPSGSTAARVTCQPPQLPLFRLAMPLTRPARASNSPQQLTSDGCVPVPHAPRLGCILPITRHHDACSDVVKG